MHGTMVTVYYGVFCASCGHFIRIGQYQAEKRGKNLRDVNPGLGKIECGPCKAEWSYHRRDVAHSLSREGTEPIYPQR